MRKMSKAAKAEAYDQVAAELEVYKRLSFMLINNTGPHGFTPDAIETVRELNDPGCVHEFRLYGCTRADGGTLVYIMHSDVNRHASVHAHRFDDWYQTLHGIGWGVGGTLCEIKHAAERLFMARKRVYEARDNA